MATKIAWADETDNPVHLVNEDGSHGGHWCRKYGPECAACYAEGIMQNDFFFFANHRPYSGPAPSPELWMLSDKVLRKWSEGGKPKRRFVGSMTDVFGEWVPLEWQIHMFDLAASSKHILMFLTKRVDRLYRAVAVWCQSRNRLFPSNIWLGCSAGLQSSADDKLPFMRSLSNLAPVLFVSYEPALEMVGWSGWEFLQWLIIGGESGSQARPYHLEWGLNGVQWAKENSVAVFHKQVGLNPWYQGSPYTASRRDGTDPLEWPEALRVQQIPSVDCSREAEATYAL